MQEEKEVSRRKRRREAGEGEEGPSNLAKRVKHEKKDDDNDKEEEEKTNSSLRKCVICTTGFDPDQRERAYKIARECGASAKGDLTKKTTHLVVLTSSPPSKSKKYEFAVRWGVHVVTLSWLEACHATRTRVPESDYPVHPPQELSCTQLSAQRRQQCTPDNQIPRILQGCVCGVLGTSAATKSAGDSLGCVEQIVRLGGRAFTVGESDFPQEMTHLVVTDVNMTSSAVISAHRACKGFVAAVRAEWVTESEKGGKRADERDFEIVVPTDLRKKWLFGGCVFTSFGFGEDSKSEEANEAWVHACGGDYVRLGSDDEECGRVTHVIVAHGSEVNDDIKGVCVSQQWIEASRTVGQMLDPNSCPILKPLPRSLPYPSMKGVTICFTGLPIQKLFLYALLARDLGATVTNNFYVKQTTHLVCGKFEGPKYDRAVEAGVPTVGLEWLDACAAEGGIQDYSLYVTPNNIGKAGTGSNAVDVLGNVLLHVFPGADATGTGRASQGMLEARRCAVRLGAQISENVCTGVTHCVHICGGDRMPDLEGMGEEMRGCVQREAEVAEGVGAYFVSSGWLVECERRAERVDETPFIIQNPLQQVNIYSQSQKDKDKSGDREGGYQQGYPHNQQPQKTMSTPLNVIGMTRFQDSGGMMGNNGIFFQTQPQRTYSGRKRSGKKGNPAAVLMNESPGFLFHQNECLLNELSSINQINNSNINNQNNILNSNNNNVIENNNNVIENNNIIENNNEGKKDADAVLLECLSELRGLQAKEGNADNNSEAIPITRSGNKHKHSHRRSGNDRRAHRTRLLVDPFSDSNTTNSTNTLVQTSAAMYNQQQQQQQGMMMMSFMDSDNNSNGGGGGAGDNNDSGNESEELFENASQIIAYAPDADQRKREDLRRKLQNSKMN